MNKGIIIALIVIVLIILGGLIVFSSGIKSDTQITFLSNASLKNGDSVEFQLTDAQGNAVAGKNISISFRTSEGVENYSIITDSEGKGSLVLNDQGPGNYSIGLNFSGDDKYNGCSANTKIIVVEETTESSTSSSYQSTSTETSESSSSSNLNHDNDLNVNYNSEGKVVGGQNDGMSYNDVKNNKPNVENGNLE